MILERKVPGALSLDTPAVVLDPATKQFNLVAQAEYQRTGLVDDHITCRARRRRATRVQVDLTATSGIRGDRCRTRAGRLQASDLDRMEADGARECDLGRQP